MKRIGIVGASGFVGSRLVEMFHLNAWAEVRPVVRGVRSLSRVARFDLDWKLANATDAGELTRALEGCDTVVHSVVGDADVIENAARVLYPAAQAAGVRRIVYLSTAS